ncbi:hypothetical protein MENTO_v1c06550 [Mesoplasma entomophilum]|uniref:Uncharacterized protein n=1 Tax=Mesoplasma entomophilum TaxID=2149 RepID=A0A3S5Y0C3_9MOLU|nr:hypothetical protein [Mesoplasma entomophilum]ATQ35787.1 hypothetical protein CS528_03430 [Mesoplasma entomophilum]ATZ19756.1 hypothetical protein MENTO_v1c06550 [Mesoplasma entomophilum]
MFYLFTKSILIEIGFKKESYYIGNAKFEFLPESVLNNCFSSANWNRALKYKTTAHEINEKYFMLEVDIYWNLNFQKIELMSKIFFFNEILNSKHFKDTFLDTLFSHYFKHTLKLEKTKSIDKTFIEEYAPDIFKDNLRIKEFDNFLILNEEINTTDKKFKSVSELKYDSFKWKVNKFNQIIYSFPKSILPKNTLVKNTDFIDLNNSLFYINSQSMLNENLTLEFCISNENIKNEILEKMILEIQKSEDPLNNWHLFNLTKDLRYLKNELLKIKNSSDSVESYLKDVYSKLKRNYDKELENLYRIS